MEPEELRDAYKKDIDFESLAAADESFAKVLKPNGQLDFSSPDAVQQLTKSLLRRDFGITITLPSDRLCPPVPNRLNYIFWLQDLVDSTSDGGRGTYDAERDVIGLDVGTGSSAIYPLLGCSLRPRWRFSATDIDEHSFGYAQANVRANKLDERIQLLHTTRTDALFPLDKLRLKSIDFTMCNPPFYASKHEMLVSATLKQRPPNSACTGSEVEMVTGGGEVAFVSRMIEESVAMDEHRVQWYTSMLGKLSSVAVIIERLREHDISNYAVTEFVQGSKTRRWAVAWSLMDLRPTAATARGIPSLVKTLLPFPPEFSITVAAGTANTSTRLNDVLTALPLQWQYDETERVGVGFAAGNVWSRASRRRSNRQSTAPAVDVPPALGVRICLQPRRDGSVTVLVRWFKGTDHVLFESFCGMLKRKLDLAGRERAA